MAERAGEFLLEVRTEEIPARMLGGAIKELGSSLFEELMRRGLVPSEIEAAYTPRRLVIVLRGLPEKEKDQTVIEVGPPVAAAYDASGQPTAAAVGFAKKFGLDASSLRRKLFSSAGGAAGAAESPGGKAGKGAKGKGGGERVYLERTYAGRPTPEVLAEAVPRLLAGMNWPKSMRWGTGVGPWVRPIHGIVALFDGAVVPFELFGVRAGRETCGHPTLSPTPFLVADVAEYRHRLVARGIVAAPEERQRRLREEMTARAAAAGGRLVEDEPLLEKLAAICEIPGVLEGSFDPALTRLPREVLTTSLRDHQSAFAAERAGELLPLFLTVMDRPDDPDGRVRAGNEWVVAARLADARFFWEKDRAQPLAARAGALQGLAFHERLGSYAAKRDRTVALAELLAAGLGSPAAERAAAHRAAELLKADLVTEMVREFTSLQGVMGGIYAREDGEPEAVWQAIYDQYLPASTDDPLPRGRAGRIVGLADRIDTLVGFFGLGQVPTGSRDPFGLRRAAQGVLRILLEGELELDLAGAAAHAHAGYGGALRIGAVESWATLAPFLADRARFLLGQRGFAHDEIEAGLGAEGEALASLPALAARVAAVQAARGEREFLAVAHAAKRIANILKGTSPGEVRADALVHEAERALHAAALAFAAAGGAALAARDFGRGLRALAALAAPLERFFVEVLVMDPDEAVRANRLALLAGIHRNIRRLADLSAVVVDKAEYR